MNLLFVHGFMGSALNWSSVRYKIESLAKQSNIELKTHAVDLLGHAARRSSRDLKSFQNAHAALSHELFLDIKDFAPTIAIGHSFGLRPLLLIAKDNPELIPTLIVEDASPELSSESRSFLQKILDETPTPFRTRESAREYFEKNYENQVARFLLSNIRSFESPEVNDWRFDKTFLQSLLEEAGKNPLWEEWHNYSGKTYLVTGEKSVLFADPEVLEKMIKKRAPHKLPHFQIKDSGHWIHSDQQEEFCKVLFEILTST
jgi:pimeloyl-ACP methyl ester carboxylesterase